MLARSPLAAPVFSLRRPSYEAIPRRRRRPPGKRTSCRGWPRCFRRHADFRQNRQVWWGRAGTTFSSGLIPMPANARGRPLAASPRTRSKGDSRRRPDLPGATPGGRPRPPIEEVRRPPIRPSRRSWARNWVRSSETVPPELDPRAEESSLGLAERCRSPEISPKLYRSPVAGHLRCRVCGPPLAARGSTPGLCANDWQSAKPGKVVAVRNPLHVAGRHLGRDSQHLGRHEGFLRCIRGHQQGRGRPADSSRSPTTWPLGPAYSLPGRCRS